MTRWTLTAAALAVVSATVSAKLPPPDEATKAKAAETAAKTAWQGKVDAYKLCQVQDRVAARYKSTHPAQAKAAAPTTPPVPAASAAVGPASVAASLAAASAPPHEAKKPAPTATASPGPRSNPVPTAAAASPGGSTPVAAVVSAAPPVTPCSDPGPFAYAPPQQKPLETSGAHSPAATATSPPSVRSESAQMAPAKPSTAPAKK